MKTNCIVCDGPTDNGTLYRVLSGGTVHIACTPFLTPAERATVEPVSRMERRALAEEREALRDLRGGDA